MTAQAVLRKINVIGLDKGKRVLTVSREQFLWLVSAMAESYPFSEEFYTSVYSDVKKAIDDGKLRNGREHYINSGFLEGRVGSPELFNAEVYRQLNPDLQATYDPSDTEGLFQHFLHFGCREGRVASEAIGHLPSNVPLDEPVSLRA